MITYELAKQLKDAGFPESKTGYNSIYDRELKKDWIIPTLSELIEACGERFRGLCRWEKGNDLGDWQAIGIPHQIYWGSTPEEAVAKLWLELNKR